MDTGNLPRFLDPLIDSIRDAVPYPLRSIVIAILTKVWRLCFALSTLVLSLAQSNPLDWDAQTILPPLIMIFTAYLALSSIYRSTTWILRTGLFFMKWGTILSLFVGAVGWIMGNARENGVGQFGMRNIATGIGAFLWEMINKPSNDAAAAARARQPGSLPQSTSRSKPKVSSGRNRKAKAKPKAWDTFEYKNEQEVATAGDGLDLQGIFADIVGRAGKAIKDSGLWDIAKSVVEGTDEEVDNKAGTRRQPANAKTKKSR